MPVRAIRGAITVENNDAEEILNATIEMLECIVKDNKLNHEDIISALFSMTNDLNAVFPAAGARHLGWNHVALMCMKEIDVPGALEKCIRVMLHINTEKSSEEIKHVYLKRADVLRPDLAKK